MQLLSLHVDTVQALQRLHIPFDDLTPEGLWGSPYHLIGVTPEQRDVLKAWNINLDEITPAALKGAPVAVTREHATANRVAREPARPATRPVGTPRENAIADQPRAVAAPSREPSTPVREPSTPARQQPAREQAAARETAPEPSASDHSSDHSNTPTLTLSSGGRAALANQQQAGNGSAGHPSPAATPTPERGAPSASRPADVETPIVTAAIADADDVLRDGAKLRTNVRGKYVEALVQQGKILLDGKTFDSTEQASKGISPDGRDLAFWEYYDERARKWRILDRT